ncbi:hypothetical protein SNOG_00264 [Parastagonospora nodorum SN15]|uniref:Luciferase-like domain-containing protein n=1 Tax=Phaeosphaeria nodorum (strain SN15 / ATCC MYA-4574 / FGSC 10173) TaxID=321614 RepID=Q0V6V0_PHANO|nr:hypothetical protein SNOG_00264 [Parastagonospora nodorum SN15]EAT91759.1 hypothetical protein SNOG_00264 [Parastagonospora nodorum SN15]
MAETKSNGADSTNGHTNGATDGYTPTKQLDLNQDPDRVLFAYWVPNVSGGLVVSKIPQKTKWDLQSNVRYAKTAEEYGFEYALTQIRFTASYGAVHQHESPWNPTVAAKQIASIDNYTNGRIAVNIVSGWNKSEFQSIGQWWLEHSERYRRSNEFIRALKGIWTAGEEGFTFGGDFYQFKNYVLSPKPLQKPHPEIFQGGNSDDARVNGSEVSDWYFMNGNDLDGFREQIADVKERARKVGREDQVRFAVNGFVIIRETEEEAIRVLQEIQGKADIEAVTALRDAVQEAGASTSNKKGMWANSNLEDLVQYNDGFKTKLIGTKEQIADRILLLKSLGTSNDLVRRSCL